AAAIVNLVLALISLVLIASETPESPCGSGYDGVSTPLHSGWVVVVTFLGSIATWLIALGFRLALPPDGSDVRRLLGRVQILCVAGVVVSAIAGYIVVGSYACFE